ncbi:MAG TPA: hypothetical protein DD723_09135 [Candidatus Omnitrophica bacterium]|nr:MAG: hypothetical protein A2Z81_08735 [Omnitrophica WOR_2 bacterium GWA2_45_18]OGX18992.1 MAG: hypothetical protein A2Y04_04760 [Omnitrophica WOR_2 bacterium GWC2_45_7]HBR15680.1 hypothetical protein [Candidatus Omnitrophota bacterium]
MMDLLKERFTKGMPVEDKLNRARELLQLLVLKIMYDKDWFNPLVFTGGTALRVLFDLRRFSEDLDFSLVKKDKYDFQKFVDQIKTGMSLNGLMVEARPKDEKTVHSTILKFPGLPHKLGISPLKDQILSIKLEIDTNPPEEGRVETTVVNKTYLFTVRHFDLPSLFATKICACFYRKYLKGRDFYDFFWYLGKRIQPNYALLNNAIEQAQGRSPGIREENVQDFLLEKLKRVDLKSLAGDVERFLEDKNEIKLFKSTEALNGIVRAAFPK